MNGLANEPGNATTTGYEYCSLAGTHGWLYRPARQDGFRFFRRSGRTAVLQCRAGRPRPRPDASCIAYLKTDNSYYMTGGLNGDSSNPRQTRYKYSPVHQDVAVCCVPNAGRIAPYFIDRMWMRNSSGLVATLLGPCKVTTTWNGTPVTIREKTVIPTILIRLPDHRGPPRQLYARHPQARVGDRQIDQLPFHGKETGIISSRRTWQPGESVHSACMPT